MEKILAFQVNDIETVKKLAGQLRIRVAEVPETELRQPLGNLAGVDKGPKAAPFTGNAPKESLLLFCGVTEKHLDKMLFELKQKNVRIDYKAVLTETNRSWNALQLYIELEKERREIADRREKI